MLGNVARGIPASCSKMTMSEFKGRRAADRKIQSSMPPALRRTDELFKNIYCGHTAKRFPQEPARTTKDSPSQRYLTPGPANALSTYRRLNRIPDDWGTAVNVQQMVFGNKGASSGLRGRILTERDHRRHPDPSGDFLPNAQGEESSPACGLRETSARSGMAAQSPWPAHRDPANPRSSRRVTCRTQSSRSRRA